jgi:hypothetical protein
MPTNANEAPLIFANSVEVHGSLNGVVNILLAAARFVPADGGTVNVEKSFVADLRFDLLVAQNIHDALTKILADQVKAAPQKMDS